MRPLLLAALLTLPVPALAQADVADIIAPYLAEVAAMFAADELCNTRLIDDGRGRTLITEASERSNVEEIDLADAAYQIKPEVTERIKTSGDFAAFCERAGKVTQSGERLIRE